MASGVVDVHIHPFLDGNGRTARLLSMLCLYRKGYDFKRLFTLSEYYDRDRPSYYRAIQSVRKRDLDLTEWLEYFTFGLQWQLAEVQDKGETLIRMDVLAKKHKLSARQLLALELAQDRSTFQMQDFEARCPGVHRRSLQRDLRELVETRLLEATGSTNRLVYRAAGSYENQRQTCDTTRDNLRHCECIGGIGNQWQPGFSLTLEGCKSASVLCSSLLHWVLQPR